LAARVTARVLQSWLRVSCISSFDAASRRVSRTTPANARRSASQFHPHPAGRAMAVAEQRTVPGARKTARRERPTLRSDQSEYPYGPGRTVAEPRPVRGASRPRHKTAPDLNQSRRSNVIYSATTRDEPIESLAVRGWRAANALEINCAPVRARVLEFDLHMSLRVYFSTVRVSVASHRYTAPRRRLFCQSVLR
jgi:hypothetical protein